MTQHTPGPWEVWPEVNGSHPDHLVYINVGPKGRRTCAVSVYGKKLPNGQTADTRSIPEDETRANARLIATAPELLEALRYMLAAQDQPFDHADRRASKDQARAAIAKATGP